MANEIDLSALGNPGDDFPETPVIGGKRRAVWWSYRYPNGTEKWHEYLPSSAFSNGHPRFEIAKDADTGEAVVVDAAAEDRSGDGNNAHSYWAAACTAEQETDFREFGGYEGCRSEPDGEYWGPVEGDVMLKDGCPLDPNVADCYLSSSTYRVFGDFSMIDEREMRDLYDSDPETYYFFFEDEEGE